jgi:beta-carotene hydroxylase
LPSVRGLGIDLLETGAPRLFLTLSAPFLASTGYFAAALAGHLPLAVLSMMVLAFVGYGSSSHDLVHRCLPLRRGLNDALLSAMELLCLRSGHAYQLAHLHHHRSFPNTSDTEARVAGRSLLAAVVDGFIQQPRIYLWAWRSHPASRRRLALEGAAVLVLVLGAMAAIPWTWIPIGYCALAIGGTCTIPFITVYLPHDPNGATPLQQTRRFRGWGYDLLAFGHLYHLEHHLFPMVPHHHWRTLAKRLDPYLDALCIKARRLP